LSRVVGENVGTYQIQQGTLSAGNNYAITYVAATLTITAKPVTVTAVAKTKVYGESDPVLTYTVNPALLSGDSFTGSLTRVSGENVGTYQIQQGTLSAGNNYAITYVAANLTITAKPITITAAAQTKTYGESDPVLTYTVNPSLLSGDSSTGSLSRVSGENVGTYQIQQGTLSAGNNYAITYVPANLTITAKEVEVVWSDLSKEYNGKAQVPTATATGVDSYDIPLALSDSTMTNVGTYKIWATISPPDANYVLSNDTTTFTIDCHPLSEIKITGDTIVCRNSSGITYVVKYEEDMKYKWDIFGGEITSKNDTNRIVVHWTDTTGTGTLTLTRTKDNYCATAINYQVEITGNRAPGITKVICKYNSNKNDSIILICADATPNAIYQWGYMDLQNDTIVFVPDRYGNYRYIRLPYFGTENYRYFVDIWYDNSGCTTRSYYEPAQEDHCKQGKAILGYKPGILVYPNPTDNEFTVELQNIDSRNFTLFITSIIGKTVFRQQYVDKIQIPLSLSLPKGMYVVSVQTDKEVLTSKIMIQ
jgi:hypothetical protein